MVSIANKHCHQLALQGRYDRHARWILGGLLIRLALKLGLHRDGETMGLSPFETEMRRRVWWALILQDAKVALMSGLGHAYLATGWWDTKEPANIDDSDLVESATEPIQSNEGPTEMIFCLLCYRLTRFIVSFPGMGCHEINLLIDRVRYPENHIINDPQLQLATSRIAELQRSLKEVIEHYCDISAGSLHQFALMSTNHILGKIKILLGDPSDAPEWMKEKMSIPDTMFAFLLEDLDHELKFHDNAVPTGFLWHVKSHFLCDIFPIFILSQLCFRTVGPLVDRAWEITGRAYHYHPELLDMSEDYSVRTGQIALRAWRHREAAMTALIGLKPDAPKFIQQIQKLLPWDRSATNSDSGSPSRYMKSVEHEQLLVDDVPALRWEPMFGTYADFANVDWDLFGSLNSDPSNLFSSHPPPPQSFGM